MLEEIKTECFDELSVDATVTGGCKQIAAPSTSLGPDTLPVNENSVSLYDDVDDFNDLTPASVGAPCTDTVTVNSVTFTREAEACYVNPGNLNTCVDTPLGRGAAIGQALQQMDGYSLDGIILLPTHGIASQLTLLQRLPRILILSIWFLQQMAGL